MLPTLVGIARAWKEQETDKWWNHVVDGDFHDDTSAEEIAGIIEANQEEPFVRESILRSLQTLWFTPDQCAVLPLAMLTREYIRDKKNPDSFFRGVCNLLLTCSQSDFGQLRDLAVAIRHALNESDPSFLRLECAIGNPRQVQLYTETGSSKNHASINMPDGARLLRLLHRNDLATEIGMADKGYSEWEGHIRLTDDIARRLSSLVLA